MFLMPNPRIIVGVDPGTRVVGYAFLRTLKARPATPRDFEVIDAGVLRASVTLAPHVRIGLLHEGLFGLMEQHEASVLVLEKAFCDKNPQSALRIGEARGAFMACAGRLGVQLEEITPAEVKKTLTGNGRAEKDDVSRALKAFTGFDRGALPHDVTDALAIALCFGLKLAAKWAVPAARAKTKTEESHP